MGSEWYGKGGGGVTGHEAPGEARDEGLLDGQRTRRLVALQRDSAGRDDRVVARFPKGMVTGVHVGRAEASQSRNQSEIE